MATDGASPCSSRSSLPMVCCVDGIQAQEIRPFFARKAEDQTVSSSGLQEYSKTDSNNVGDALSRCPFHDKLSVLIVKISQIYCEDV